VKKISRGLLVVSVVSVLILFAFLRWFHSSSPNLDAKAVSAAQDEVYAAVVRDIVPPSHGRSGVSHLVFGETLQRSDGESCQENARRQFWSEIDTPPFNSPADKLYRFFTYGGVDSLLRPDTIRDFADKSCTGGRLSQTFHTDLPRIFVDVETYFSAHSPKDKNGKELLMMDFPPGIGVISFSRVGLDSSLNEAIVSVSYVCGGLCGTGSRYVLRKTRGSWRVVSKRIVWVS
jgi:hypothetical protein